MKLIYECMWIVPIYASYTSGGELEESPQATLYVSRRGSLSQGLFKRGELQKELSRGGGSRESHPTGECTYNSMKTVTGLRERLTTMRILNTQYACSKTHDCINTVTTTTLSTRPTCTCNVFVKYISTVACDVETRSKCPTG
jgi:hypothetical protein